MWLVLLSKSRIFFGGPRDFQVAHPCPRLTFWPGSRIQRRVECEAGRESGVVSAWRRRVISGENANDASHSSFCRWSRARAVISMLSSVCAFSSRKAQRAQQRDARWMPRACRAFICDHFLIAAHSSAIAGDRIAFVADTSSRCEE